MSSTVFHHGGTEPPEPEVVFQQRPPRNQRHFLIDFNSQRLAQMIPTSFHPGGTEPEVVFQQGFNLTKDITFPVG